MVQRYVLDQDDDGHWYLLKVEDIKTFNELIECDYDELTADGEQWLDERRINGGASSISFIDPEEIQ